MQEDYIVRRNRRFHGVNPVLGRVYTLAWGDPEWPEWMTFNMAAYNSILVEIKALKKPSGIVLYGSRVATPRLLDIVWSYDEIRNPVRLQTNNYWVARTGCNATGCPKLRFQVIRGSLNITILERTRR